MATNNNEGTRKSLQAWIKKNLYMTYTEYMRKNADWRSIQYNKYIRGDKVSVAATIE